MVVWQHGRVAANKISVNFNLGSVAVWQHGRVAANIYIFFFGPPKEDIFSVHLVVYMVFFAESSLPGTHRCDVILRAILKSRTWVTAGG